MSKEFNFWSSDNFDLKIVVKDSFRDHMLENLAMFIRGLIYADMYTAGPAIRNLFFSHPTEDIRATTPEEYAKESIK